MKSFAYTTKSLSKSFLLLLLLACSGSMSAQLATLSVQGVLTKSDGTAVDDDTYTMTFRLWNDPSATGAANKKYEETIANVETTGGVYSVVLGANGQNLDAKFDEIYYLGVSMNNSSVELLPRPRLTHAPYALGIKGEHNTFPSLGGALADAYRAKGGPPNGAVDGNGFGFQAGTGDANGGLFSAGSGEISLYANGSHKVKLTGGLNELFGQTNSGPLAVSGTLTATNITSGDHTINGNSQVNGWQVVTGDERVEGNQICNNKFLTKRVGDGGGYSFDYDGAYDTGMFGYDDGYFVLRVNGVDRVNLGVNTVMDNEGGLTEITSISDVILDAKQGHIYFRDMKEKSGNGNWKNIAMDLNSGKVVWENSTRRYKRNIRPLEDDFSLILKSMPRVYNRLDDTIYWELGYIAEEMDSIGLHKLVQRNNEGIIDGFDYNKMILYAVEVLKIQDAAIKDLRAELEAMKAENAGLQTQNSNLRSENGNLTQQQANFSAQLESLSKRMQLLEAMDSSGSKK